MFERFTDRARRAIQLANQEAQRFNHERLGDEHILLGLVKESTGVAAAVLRNRDVNLRKLRLEVERLMEPGAEMITMGRLPLTPRAKRVIEYAMEESVALNHGYVGTEHLLLGLLRDPAGVAAQVLTSLGLELADLRQEVMWLLGKGDAGQAERPKLRPVRRVTAEEEDFRIETAVPGNPQLSHFGVIKRDMVKPEPEGTIVLMAFRVTGYDQDCDGGAMARLEHIDKDGETTGWTPDKIGLYPEADLVVTLQEWQAMFSGDESAADSAGQRKP